MGTVYLIHFDRPIGDLTNPHGQAQHYLGFTNDLDARLAAHRSGNGSKIMSAVSAAAIGWQVVRTWEGGRTLERKLKNQHNSPRLCPICNGKKPTTKHAERRLQRVQETATQDRP